MSHPRNTGPVPEANRSPYGPHGRNPKPVTPEAPEGEPLSNQDEKGRLGNYQTKGEHAIQQPGGKQGSKREG